MSYCGMVYRISFKRLGALRGSGAVQVIRKLTAGLAADGFDDDDGEDEDEQDLPSPSEALRQIIMGEPLVEDYPDPYGAALVAIYNHIGCALKNAAVAPVGWQHLKDADAALAGEGLPEPVRFSGLFGRGLPVLDLPSPEPFPTFGYITPEEVASAHGRIQQIRWFRYDDHLHPVLHLLDYWLNEAAGEDQGLVGCYG